MAQFIVQFRGQALALVFLGREQLRGQRPQFSSDLRSSSSAPFMSVISRQMVREELDLALRVAMGQDYLGYGNFAAVPPLDGALPPPEVSSRVYRLPFGFVEQYVAMIVVVFLLYWLDYVLLLPERHNQVYPRWRNTMPPPLPARATR